MLTNLNNEAPLKTILVDDLSVTISDDMSDTVNSYPSGGACRVESKSSHEFVHCKHLWRFVLVYMYKTQT